MTSSFVCAHLFPSSISDREKGRKEETSADTIAKRGDRRGEIAENAGSVRTPYRVEDHRRRRAGEMIQRKERQNNNANKRQKKHTFFHFGSSLLGADALLFGLNMFLSGIGSRTF